MSLFRGTVVTGATGQLGTAFRAVAGRTTAFLARSDLDLSQPLRVAQVLDDLEPKLVINCAGYTAVDRAESEPEIARAVNTESVEALAEWCHRKNARLVTFSTDYVFDGTKDGGYVESDTTNPLNVYGATKLAGEQLALAAAPDTLVVRTSWVLSGTHPNFAATMLRLARARAVDVVDDQRGRPTLVDDLAPAVMGAITAGATGILHLTNQGAVTWYGLARMVLDMAGVEDAELSPCTTAEFPRPATRPANSVLDSERLEELGLEPMPHFEPALRRAVAMLEAQE